MLDQNTHRHKCDAPACEKGHCQPGKTCEVVDRTMTAFYIGMRTPNEINISSADAIILKCMRDLRKMHRDN